MLLKIFIYAFLQYCLVALCGNIVYYRIFIYSILTWIFQTLYPSKEAILRSIARKIAVLAEDKDMDDVSYSS